MKSEANTPETASAPARRSDTPATAWSRWLKRCGDAWAYCSQGVWDEPSDTLKIKFIKTLSLAVRTFMSSDLQSRACALTYRSLLALVPALAMLFAIGRGFGLQGIMQRQLYAMFPAQRQAIEMAVGFVDSCLAQASEGIFVGVGIVFLLWTVVSLLDSVEEAFNGIWNVTVDRSFLRKVTDYLSICIILPILMICSGGLQLFMSTAIQRLVPFHFVTPLIEVGFDVMSWLFGCLFFVGAYMLIPNARVAFKNALVSGFVAGTAFQVLQWLFLSGQLYVAKYNAIYGSFSFLPLMLIWMQLSWLITLAGALICYSAQNIAGATFGRQVDNISESYRLRVTLAILSVVVGRFHRGEKPLNQVELASRFGIPSRLVGLLVKRLVDAGLLVRIAPAGDDDIHGDMPLQPARDLSAYTIGNVVDVLANYGDSDFIPSFGREFAKVGEMCEALERRIASAPETTPLYEL